MRIFKIFILFFIGFSAFSQENHDFGIWLGGDFSKKINKKITLDGSLALRTDDNSTNVRQFFYELGGSYKITKELRTKFKYRNRFGFDYTGRTINNRFIWDVSYKFKFEEFGLQIRNRLQKNFAQEGRNKVMERVRLKADFKLQKGLKGFVYNEVFYDLNSNQGVRFDSNRWGLGMKYKINKDLEITLAYLQQRDFSSKMPSTFNAVNLEIAFDF